MSMAQEWSLRNKNYNSELLIDLSFKMKKNIFYVVSVLMAVASCTNKDYTKEVHDPLLYSQTVKKLNDIVLENNFPPMIASRNYVYANIAAFEVIAAGDSNYISLAHQIKHMPSM